MITSSRERRRADREVMRMRTCIFEFDHAWLFHVRVFEKLHSLSVLDNERADEKQFEEAVRATFGCGRAAVSRENVQRV